ncbi:hypothetical protein ACFFRE_09120 [Aciditerrimonas ferrireducens]|uniref:ATP synthase F0 subunit B n=1 Tax=Aciditerrimonas ferrireducens TaxID=667306 RepID=A0ABV6C7S2_9ACTN|nr:hypothetical protein [Aciditerrimonas ferrireducens]MCK4177951.1 hypothetical protein [Aciditerrimonas ferrireducens]
MRRGAGPEGPEPWEATGELPADEVAKSASGDAGGDPVPAGWDEPLAWSEDPPREGWSDDPVDRPGEVPTRSAPGDPRSALDPLASAPGVGGTSETEDLLGLAIEMVAGARRAPLSASVLVSREELLDLLEQARRALPGELREARYLLREREAFLAQQRREGERILEEVRARAEQMVQRSEVVRQAEQQAQRILEAARQEARRLQLAAEDYCDERLAKLEVALERTLGSVRAGRKRLAGQRQGPGAGGAGGGGTGGSREEGDDHGLYDQDRG